MIEQSLIQEIIADFDTKATNYKTLVEKTKVLIGDILAERGIVVHSITGRPKVRESLLSKLNKIDSNYKSLTDITDLAGIRIITYFAGDVDKVAKAIEEEFNVDPENSVDKRRSLAVDRFGYLSLHHVVSIGELRNNLPEYRALQGLKAEIQTRSILQHAWAEIEHDLGYKSTVEVPQHIRRRFARIASLLELADEEFEGIKAELDSYRAVVTEAIRVNPEDVSLNLDSLQAFVAVNPVVARIDNAIVKITGSGRRGEAGVIHTYLKRMQQVGIDTIGQLTVALESNEELIVQFAKDWMKTKHPALPSGVSIFYLWLILFSVKDEDTVISEFEKIEFDEPSSQVAKELIVIAERNRRKIQSRSNNK